MYQTMSPDSLPSSSIRKSNHFRSSKEDQNCPENGRIQSSISGNSTITSSQQQYQTDQPHNHQNNNNLSHMNQTHISNNIHNLTHNHESNPSRSQCLGGSSGGGGSDILLQWGQRKRSRCSRTESRSMLGTGVSEKNQNANHIMPPPHPSSFPSTSSNNGSRSGGGTSRDRPNGLLYAKDGSGFLPCKNRNLADQMGCSSSASPLRNGGGGGGGRAISRSSVGKRSPSCIDKNDKKVSVSGSIRKVKLDDSLPHTGNGNHLDSAHGEQENGWHGVPMARSPAEAEKASNEVVEWPRIYLSLSRKEKEDDFYAMKGTKLPHRPKKRAKAVDRALQYCFPGLWLSDLTRARYEVRERKSTKKPKRKGLKGLESSMDSESE